MLRHWLAIVVIVALLPATSFAQGTGGVDPDKANGVPESEEATDTTPAETTSTEPVPANFTTHDARNISWLIERVELLSQNQIANNNKVDELEKKLEEMEVLQAKVDAMEVQLRDMKVLQETVNTLQSQLEGLDPVSETALGRMAADPDFRSEMGRAMQGRLELQNFLGVPKIIYINGTAWTVRTGESYIYVPVGKVSIQDSRDAEPKFIDMEEWKADAGQMVTTYKLTP